MIHDLKACPNLVLKAKARRRSRRQNTLAIRARIGMNQLIIHARLGLAVCVFYNVLWYGALVI